MAIPFRKTAHITLAVFLLLCSIGVSFNKMACLSKGKTAFSLLEKKSCCPSDERDENTDAFNARCCDFTSGYVQVDLISKENPVKIKAARVAILPVLINQFHLHFFKLSSASVTKELPPLLHGVSLLKAIQVFRI